MQSQDLAHENNKDFINRFDKPINSLIESIEKLLNILNPVNGDLNIQGNLVGKPRTGGIDDKQYRLLVNAQKIINRTDYTILSLENLIGTLIPYQFNIIFGGNNTVSLIIPKDVALTEQERIDLISLLPHPCGIKWLLQIKEFSASYGKNAKYGDTIYYNPKINN